MQGPSGTEDDTAIDEDDNMQTLVWGTNIHVPTLCRRIRRFLRHFEERDTGESKYVALLQQVSIFRTAPKNTSPARIQIVPSARICPHSLRLAKPDVHRLQIVALQSEQLI